MNERIKELRKALGFTQQQFADKIGVKQNTIAQYEIGRNEPIDSVINLIVEKYHVNEDWLRNGTGEMFIRLSRDEEIASFIGKIQFEADDSFKKRFISMLSALDTEDWVVLEKMALTIYEERKDGSGPS